VTQVPPVTCVPSSRQQVSSKKSASSLTKGDPTPVRPHCNRRGSTAGLRGHAYLLGSRIIFGEDYQLCPDAEFGPNASVKLGISSARAFWRAIRDGYWLRRNRGFLGSYFTPV